MDFTNRYSKDKGEKIMTLIIFGCIYYSLGTLWYGISIYKDCHNEKERFGERS